MVDRNDLLLNLIQVLVNQWGQDKVQAALTRATSPNVGKSFGDVTSRTSAAQSKLGITRPNAVSQVARTDAKGEEREALFVIAKRFDDKIFLPSVADAREFIIMLGKRPGAMKDRSDAFRVLLGAITELPPGKLNELLHSVRDSGLGRLGPISDAISKAAEQMPGRSSIRTSEGDMENILNEEIKNKDIEQYNKSKKNKKAIIDDKDR